MSGPTVFVQDEGSGEPILFLHAFPLESSMWDPQTSELQTRFRCLRPDFWGCGESDEILEPSIDGFADAVVEELTRRGVGKFSVVGTSMGGYIAVSILDRMPERVEKAVLVATRATGDTPEGIAERHAMANALRSEGVDVIVESMLARLLSDTAREDIELTTYLRTVMLHQSPEAIAGCQEAMAKRPDRMRALEHCRVPTLVVGGSDDAFVSPEVIEALAAVLPDSRLAMFEDVGHLVTLEAPTEFSELVTEFLT